MPVRKIAWRKCRDPWSLYTFLGLKMEENRLALLQMMSHIDDDEDYDDVEQDVGEELNDNMDEDVNDVVQPIASVPSTEPSYRLSGMRKQGKDAGNFAKTLTDPTNTFPRPPEDTSNVGVCEQCGLRDSIAAVL
ncbi:Na/Pi-cotransporter [Striga asiatica]|uniref:Na/Pi-cotransporter n=1 Tax=Striga asiatica TaxID=4170 RepID=A0A5A7PP83_STRAF|nr:Na/Pi-cotransporter [Striga asiatica]